MTAPDYFPEITKEADLYLPLAELFRRIHGGENAKATVEITDKNNEHKHGCDLILDIGRLSKIGFQIKITPFTRSTLTEYKRRVKDAYDFRFGGEIKRLSQFIWVTTSYITSAIPGSEFDDIEDSVRFGKIERWDGERLRKEFRTYYPEAFTSIRIDDLTAKADQQSIKGNNVFAAHYLYRVFVLRLLQSDLASAREVIKSAISEVDRQKNKSIYFYRTLKRVYEIWEAVIEGQGFDELVEKYKKQIMSKYKMQTDEYEKTWHECVFLMHLVNDAEVRKHVESHEIASSACGYNVLCDFQYMFSQLQILFHEYANSPAGLSSRQICRTLLRFGFPPEGNIAERIKKTIRELKDEDDQSVDGECSLCTGTILSCLVLANEDQETIKPVKGWLEQLDDYRYSHIRRDQYTDAKSTEHALHYAAPVLEAFIDCGDSENVVRVLRHYFVSRKVGRDGFYDSWMRHRNISSLETCSYILSAFHKYFINGNDHFHFDETQLECLTEAITNLVNVLHIETTPQSKPSRLYATRENTPSFCLALLVMKRRAYAALPESSKAAPVFADSVSDQFDSASDLLRELMQNLHKRAIRFREGDRDPFRKALLDSNVDRTTRFIEGWVSYWETISYLVNDASPFAVNGTKLKRTVKELRDDGYLPNYN
jgi:hypothetical protein